MSEANNTQDKTRPNNEEKSGVLALASPHQLQVLCTHYMERIHRMIQQSWRQGFGIALTIERFREIMTNLFVQHDPTHSEDERGKK